MTRRERVLGLCVGGVLAGLALYAIGKHVLWGPIQTTQDKISAARREQDQLRAELAELADVEEQWAARTAETLAADPKQAQLRFRDSIHELLERYDLVGDPDTKETKISTGNPGTHKHSGFTDVPLTIKTTGTLKQIVGFLRDFYRQPYIARLDKVSLQGDQSVINEAAGLVRRRSSSSSRGARSSRGRRGADVGPDGPLLTVNITATTLVLPKIKGIRHESVPWPPTELELGALQGGDLAVYDDIFRQSLFAPYKEKPVVVKQPDKPKPTPQREREPIVDRQPVDPRPDAPYLFPRGVSMLDGRAVVYVYNDRERAEPPAQRVEDDELDDGRLLLIHRKGLVVRVTKPGRPARDYFYPLGHSFAEREELSPETHPEIWKSLQEEFLNWPGGGTVATRSGRRS